MERESSAKIDDRFRATTEHLLPFLEDEPEYTARLVSDRAGVRKYLITDV